MQSFPNGRHQPHCGFDFSLCTAVVQGAAISFIFLMPRVEFAPLPLVAPLLLFSCLSRFRPWAEQSFFP
jgi:hypothetical protein